MKYITNIKDVLGLTSFIFNQDELNDSYKEVYIKYVLIYIPLNVYNIYINIYIYIIYYNIF